MRRMGVLREVNMKLSSGPRFTRRDMVQVNAFKSFFKCSEGTPEERLARAVVVTSDQVFRKAVADPVVRDQLARLFRMQRKASRAWQEARSRSRG